MLEMVFRIDRERWDEGLEKARRAAEFDTWHQVWRAPIEGTLVQDDFADDETWGRAVARCQRDGWLIATVIDPAHRPVPWASPQFPTDKPGEWLPVAFVVD